MCAVLVLYLTVTTELQSEQVQTNPQKFTPPMALKWQAKLTSL